MTEQATTPFDESIINNLEALNIASIAYNAPPKSEEYIRPPMSSYYQTLAGVRAYGNFEPGSRVSQHTLALHHQVIRYRMHEGWPIDSSRPVAVKGAIGEMLSFIRGYTNIRDFKAMGCHFWDNWADKDGELGPIYGANWTSQKTGINQLQQVIDQLKNRPFSRRHHVNSWNMDVLPDESVSPQVNASNGRMALAPCHISMTFSPSFLKNYIRLPSEYFNAEHRSNADLRLDLAVRMRSCDLPAGQPHNAIGYHALLEMVAHLTGMTVGYLTFYIDNAHIYLDQLSVVDEHLRRIADNNGHVSQRVYLDTGIKDTWPDNILDFAPEHFKFSSYTPLQPALKYPVTV